MFARLSLSLALVAATATAAHAQRLDTSAAMAPGGALAIPVPASSRGQVIAIDMSDTTVSSRPARLIRTELDRLWSPYGVTLAWPEGPLGESDECVAVKVVFTDDEPGIQARPNRRPLGIVYRVGGLYRRVIFVSPAAVMRLVRRSSNEPRASLLVTSLHARMMARVIAHELGHILLEPAAGARVARRCGVAPPPSSAR